MFNKNQKLLATGNDTLRGVERAFDLIVEHLEVGDGYGLALGVVGVFVGDLKCINYVVLDGLL